MSEAKHTPGPRWQDSTVTYDFEETAWVIYVPDSRQTVSASDARPIVDTVQTLPDLLQQRNELLAAAKQVELWWLDHGQYQLQGAPACIFGIRATIASMVLSELFEQAVPGVAVVEAAKQESEADDE